MLRSKSSSSRARAASTSSRSSPSSRGRGRGAPSSSSKYSFFAVPNYRTRRGSRDSRERTPSPKRSRAAAFAYRHNKLNFAPLGTPSNTSPSNPFEKERLENAAKREQRGQESTGVSSRGARGTSRGRYQNKSVRFASPPIQPPRESSTADFSTPIATESTPSPFANLNPNASSAAATTSQVQLNPFASASNTAGSSLFGTSTNGIGWNPFSTATSVKIPQTNPFGGSQITNETQISSVFGAPSGLSSGSSTSNPFSSPAPSFSAKTSIYGTTTSPSLSSDAVAINPFTANKAGTPSNASNLFSMGTRNLQRRPEGQSQSSSSQDVARTQISAAPSPFNPSKNKLAIEIDTLLRKNGIIAPSWPTSAPGDPSQKAAVEGFWQNLKAYRARVRTCLIRNGYLDDPDKPKKLSEAIDFKGTCEGMCPEFEKVTRIVEHDVQSAEKELSLDGQTYWPALHKMVKALARSAAGQDAPLPEDVRSPAALRRTLDYLINIVLGTNDLPAIHGFLWDRTRAIRRDFVFQQSSMTSQELLDQVYCLEQITRFHVVALHQMSHEDVVAEDFSEQQEVEQLGKALLSLIHAYEDCMAQGIRCENEPEFRAYYVLFNSHNTGILEAVQDWGWKYWGESDDIRTAVSLVETLQNVWDTQGPLKPHSATDIAQNAYHRFFSIIEDTKVSYTMACFAEIHFNKVRKAALKTILAGYRKQRDQTTDWTLERLNIYLHFDDEKDIVTFGEAYGVHFDILNGQECLSFEADDPMMDPFPQLKQPHSYKLVEKKRGDHTLPEVIHHTVYEETTEEATEEDDGNSLFVPSFSTGAVREQPAHSRLPVTDAFPEPPDDPLDDPLIDDTPFPAPDTSKPLIQIEQTDTQATKSQNHSEAKGISSSSLGTFAPAKDSRPGHVATFSEKNSGPGESKPVGNTSIFESKSIIPQKGIFSFLEQNKPSPSSSSTAFFPLVAPTQTTEASKPSVPPSSRPLFSSVGSSGGLASSQVIPPPLTLTTNTTQSGSISDAAKDATHKYVESEKVDRNREESKQKSVDHSNSNRLAVVENRSPVVSAPKKSRIATFAQWVALSQDGLIDQFIESTVEKILMQTVKTYVTDEKKRRSQEEEKLSREEAAHFRFRFLATKYFYAWRDIAHRLWMRRKGRLARQARRQMAEESFRASRASEKRDVVEDFRASRDAKRQNTEQSLIPAVDGSPSHTGAKHIPRESKKGNRLTNGESPKPSRQKQSSPDDILRKSLLSDSAYLQGGSRIHLIPNYKPSMESRHQPNGVKTDYFRLKARGIMTLPDGTPLANTAAVHLNHKRSLDNIHKSMTPERLTSKHSAGSAPPKPVTNDFLLSGTSTERDSEFEALKARARAVMAKDKEEKQKNKRLLDDDEVELFASAKRVRDQMDEESLWMRAEIQKSMSRSSS